MQKASYVDHVALRLGNIPYYTKFFETVFGMSPIRVDGPADNPRCPFFGTRSEITAAVLYLTSFPKNIIIFIPLL